MTMERRKDGRETWHRLLTWDKDAAAAERLSALVLVQPGPRVLCVHAWQVEPEDHLDDRARQMRLKVNDSAMTGTIFFDPAISFPRALSMSQSLTIDAKVPDGTANVIKMPMRQTLSVRLVDVGDVLPQ